MNNVLGHAAPTHHIGAGPQVPIGRLEVATVQGRTYGIDRVGQVFRMEPAVCAPRSPLRRLLAAVVAR